MGAVLTAVARVALRTGAVLLLASLATFALGQFAPGEFFDEARLAPGMSAGAVDGLRARYGLDRPWPVRYGRWLAGAAHGDLGLSLAYNAPVASLVAERVGNTLLLAASGAGLAWLIAVPWGAWAAVRAQPSIARVSAVLIAVTLALPDLLVALLLRLFALRSGLLPASGMTSPAADGSDLADVLRHLILPAVAVALSLLPAVWRHARSAVAETFRAPFVLAAKANGIPPARLLFRHVLPAAANPLISLFGLTIGSLLSLSLIAETIFAWPGLGPLILEAASARDMNLILGAVLASALLAMAGSAVTDLALRAADPRIRRPAGGRP